MGKAQRAHRSFAERPSDFPHVSSPIRGQLTALDELMETAVRPVDDTRDIPMLHRIKMNVVDMPLKIRVIADRMLPVAALPDAFLAL